MNRRGFMKTVSAVVASLPFLPATIFAEEKPKYKELEIITRSGEKVEFSKEKMKRKIDYACDNMISIEEIDQEDLKVFKILKNKQNDIVQALYADLDYENKKFLVKTEF